MIHAKSIDSLWVYLVWTLACPFADGHLLANGQRFAEYHSLAEFQETDARENQDDKLSLEQLYQLANKSVASGDYAEAAKAYAKMTKSVPKDRQLRFRLANTQLMAGKPQLAVKNFEKLVELAPSGKPQLWQLGIAYFYAGKFEEGKKLFELHQTVNSSDVENSVWHLLCHAKLAGLEKARNQKIEIKNDRRIPMNEIYKMFMGESKPASVLQAAQQPTPTKALNGQAQTKMQMYYAHLYIGLYQHMTGDPEAARESMKQAIELKPAIRGRLMFEIPEIHLAMFPAKKESSND